MATLYFNAAVNNNWATLGNWWTSDAFTTQASALPTSGDSVVLSETCTTNSGSAPTVVNLTFTNTPENSKNFGIAITVTGMATFNVYWLNDGTVGGNAVFSGAENLGTVTGNATFNDVPGMATAVHYGTVGGDATFSDTSYNEGTVTGNAVFNGNSYCELDVVVTGNATFYDYSANRGDTGGSIYYDYSYNDGSYLSYPDTFNDNSRCYPGGAGGYGRVDATFNDNSILEGYPQEGDATFNDDSRASFLSGEGCIDNATFNDRSCGNGTAKVVTITGGPIQTDGMSGNSDGNVAFNFTRAQLGINGSSILGVI
jgi:hypothetical protein